MSGDSDTARQETDEEREHEGVTQLGQPGPAVGPGLARLSRDRSYKAVFQCAEPVEHLIRFVLSDMQQGEEWLQRMDFSTLEPLPTETIDPWLRAGYQDIAWRLRVRATGSGGPEWLRLLILVEFQSTVEYDMPLRMQGYVQRMHELAWKERHVRRTDRLPPVLAVVFYNGARPWRAKRSVWGLTNKRGLRPLDRAVTRMPVGMRYELVDVKQHAAGSLSKDNVVELMISTELLGKDLDPEAVHSILEAQGRLLGSQHQRRVLGVLRGWTRLTIARTGVDLEILEDTVKMQEMQRSGTMLTYLEACAQEYQAKLRAEGRVEALDEDKVSLCKLAERRFGVVAATDLARWIEGIDAAARLWEIVELIFDCEDASEFAARLREIA